MASLPSRPLFRLVVLVLISLVTLEVLLPTGCIGIQAIVGKRHIELTHKLKATPNAPGVGGMGLISTQAEALQLWGKPRRQRVLPNGHLVWKYRSREMKWRGAVVWAVLPVPLLVPTGRRKVWLEFAGDSLQSVRTQCVVDRAFGFIGPMVYFGRPVFRDSFE